MLSIGEFSRIARVSCRLLRHYDQLDLLKPKLVDEDTGYRYYAAEQLSRLNRILVLKELGFRLEEIGPILEEEVGAERLRGMLAMRRKEVERTLEKEADRLRHIETRIAQIDEAGALSDDDVVLRNEPERLLFALRTRAASFAEAKRTLAAVVRTVTASVPRRALGPLVVLAHAEVFEPEELDLEIGYFVNEPLEPLAFDDAHTIALSTLPSVEAMAACVRVGPPERAHLTTARIGRYVERNGYRLEAPSREVFVEPFDPRRPEASVVEMQFPLARPD